MDCENKSRLAVVTVTMNDGYKLKEWYSHYLKYKDEILLHIIVDNASNDRYLLQVEELFKDSIIIKRTTNGGSTIAYNDGIRYALSQKNIDYISLVGNDIKLQSGALSSCVEVLKNDSKIGMCGPIILKKDSLIVEDYGSTISNRLSMIPYMEGIHYDCADKNCREVEMITGGMNVSSRIFYETVGVQDEKLFMYSDEVDMALRAKSKGFKMAVLGYAISWHQHINENTKNDKRHPYSKYLIARNKVYLSKKHYGLFKQLYITAYYIGTAIKQLMCCTIKREKEYRIDACWQLFGAINGLIGNMNPNKYSHL